MFRFMSLLCMLAFFAACANNTEERTSKVQQAVEGDPVPQHVDPVFNQTGPPHVGGVTPSAMTPLPIGEHINVLSDFQHLSIAFSPQPFIVQLLSGRTYFVSVAFHTATVFVGDQGVLVIDAPSVLPGDGSRLVQAIQSITSLPVTMFVYSHNHVDHAGSVGYLKSVYPAMEIVGTKWLDRAIVDYGLPVPRPTKVISIRVKDLEFESWTFRVVTPEPSAHTVSDSYIVTPDRVMHVCDIVQSGKLSFVENSVVMNQEGFLRMARRLAGEQPNYDFINPCHLNIAYHEDVQRILDFHQAMYNGWWQLANPQIHPELQLTSFIDPGQDNSGVWVRNWFDAMALNLYQDVAPQFASIPYIEVARDHANKVHEDLFLNRMSPDLPPTIPSFAPLPALLTCGDYGPGCGG